ncbi:hypothetical protein AcV7_002144 [Taiwanofungus camphoratus]|nr:hypothetical protein AcV7_002144 [Antrodia cinnamomea]
MSTTTQILFNSPALHSLKREQLVKLCKIHSIKATGKNAELIERLKQRAQEVPQNGLTNTSNIDEKDLLSDTCGSDEDANPAVNASSLNLPRPSEQWEIVMEDIEEVVESSSMGTSSSKGTFRNASGFTGEFGTGNSKTSTVSSSIKALATSLGIKRANSGKPDASSRNVRSSALMPSASYTNKSEAGELTANAVPYSSLPPSNSLPQTDHFTLTTPDSSTFLGIAEDDTSMSAPVPGSPSRPGAPAPADGRLSMGAGLTTTVRLISATSQNLAMPSPPRLAPFQTTFDLEMGSPGGIHMSGHDVSVWPSSPGNMEERLYPAIPLEDLFQSAEDDNVGMPGGLSKKSVVAPQATPVKVTEQQAGVTPKFKPIEALDMFSPMPPKPESAQRLSMPRNEPFLFGSPLPQHNLSNKDFGQAAASVLEEMNKRLAEAGVQKVDKGLQGKATGEGYVFGNHVGAVDGRAHSRAESPDRFAKVHENAFSKMDSITTHYAARRGMQTTSRQAPGSKKRKSDVLGVGSVPVAKRKSSAAGARVISTGVRKKMGIPGAFGDGDDDENDDEEDPGERRSSKRIRVADEEDVHQGKRVSIAPPLRIEGELDEGEMKKKKEREAIRRKLDANKARRRSSRGRVSVGAKGAIGPGKGKASRFGFFSSAKSIVRNVWNMGTGSSSGAKSKASSNSSIPVVKTPQATKAVAEDSASTAFPARKPSEVSGNAAAKSTNMATRIPSGGPSSSSLLKPSASVIAKADGTLMSTRSTVSRSRSPIPSFAAQSHGPSSSVSSRNGSLIGTANSRIGPSVGTGTAGLRVNSRNSSIAGASSMGTRSSLTSGPRTAVSSIGTRRSMASTLATGSSTSKASISSAQAARDGANGQSVRKRTSSLMAPTASSLAKTQSAVRPSGGRSSGLPVVTENPRVARAGKTPTKIPIVSKTALGAITNSPQSPRPGKIFNQPLTVSTFSSPTSVPTPKQNPSFTAAATTMLGTPSGIPKLSVPPKPKALIARKPRISRSRVIAKLGAQRAATQSSASASGPSTRIRSSMGSRKSFGGVKAGRSSAGADAMRSAVKKRARQSEYARRQSHVVGTVREGGQESGDATMDIDD